MLKTRFMLAAVTVAAAAIATPTVAVASGGSDDDSQRSDRRCAREFDAAQRTDMESFRDYDLPTWKAGHDDDAITIFASGQWFQGRDTIAAVLHRHFENREAIFTWTEVSRAVDGCTTGTILYDSTYAIPSANFTQRTYVSVVYTRKHGRWLSVLDQSTLLKTP
jgi:hypothetical protein